MRHRDTERSLEQVPSESWGCRIPSEGEGPSFVPLAHRDRGDRRVRLGRRHMGRYWNEVANVRPTAEREDQAAAGPDNPVRRKAEARADKGLDRRREAVADRPAEHSSDGSFGREQEDEYRLAADAAAHDRHATAGAAAGRLAEQ